jgi:predicted ATPase/DNA-binding winged helix-turn-helix (wHTH) protein
MKYRPAGSMPAHADRLSFIDGRIEVDLLERKLFIDGRSATIGSRSFDLLGALLRQRDQVCTKADLMQAVWPGMVVEENNLHVQVTALRKLLGATAVANVHGRGYAWTIKPDVPAAQALFGREALLAAASALLDAPSTRLLTLHGPGGVGKTRLAQALLDSTAPPRDGHCLLALAPLTPDVDLADVLARALGLRPDDTTAPLPLLLGHLAKRQMLLVLDNVEHLPGIPPLLMQLLATCPQLKLLTTSRTRTKLEQEVTLEVPPLPVPQPGAAADAAPCAALRLFLQRAHDFGHPLADLPRERQAAAAICRRLDGLPLALELAAARLRLMSAIALQEQIERSHRVVGAGSDVSPGRQRSLHDTLIWSAGLLSPGARRMLCRLGVFRGGFDLSAALTVATDADASPDLATALDRLTELLDMHLVQRQDGQDGQVRYAMLETIRQFAVEALRDGGEEGPTALRHAQWFSQVAETHDRALRTRQRMVALSALASEQANLRSALGFLVHQRRDAAAALRLVGAMSWAWYFAGTMREGRQWQDDALALPMASDIDAADGRRWRARVLSGACRLLLYLDDITAAVTAGQEAVTLARDSGDIETLAYALFHLAIPTRRRSAAASVALHDEAQALFGRLGDAWGQALTTCYGGIPLAFDSQQQAAALQRLGEGRRLFEQLDDDWGCNVADQYLSVMALRRGDLDEAEQRAQSVYRTARGLDDGFRLASAMHQLGRVAIAAGRFADAEAMLLHAAEVNAEQGRYGYAAHLLRQCARLLVRRGEHRLAARVLGAASVDEHPLLIPNVLPEEALALDAAHDGVRERLGQRVFAECIVQGRAWSLAEAIEKTRRSFAGTTPA